MEDHKKNEKKRVWKRTGLVLSVAAIELTAIYGFSHIDRISPNRDREETTDTIRYTESESTSTEPSPGDPAISSYTTPSSLIPTETVFQSDVSFPGTIVTTVADSTTVPPSTAPSESISATSAADTEVTAAATDAFVTGSETSTATVCEFVTHGNTEQKKVAFTFDDKGENLAKILEALDARGIKGTFFLMAGELEKNPELWQTAVANGHIVLNHTVHHYTNLSGRSDDTIRSEILGWEDTAKTVLGEDYVQRMKKDFPYFRSPGGGKSERLLRILGELGYTKMVYWSVEDIYFSSHNPDKISMSDHYVQDASNGGIFLLHPGDWSYVGDIIDRLEAEEYTFVTVPELFN